MATPRTAKPVKLIVGLLSSDVDLLRRTKQLLVRKYGPTDLESEICPFDKTDYYEPEMGPDLQRIYLTFETLIRPDKIVEIKRQTNQIEQQIAEQTMSVVPRPVNIDPGYLDIGKLVLATTKDANHRLYLGQGIYGESTLRYISGEWTDWPWTYPDYRKPETCEFFAKARDLFRNQRKAFLDMPKPPNEDGL